MQKFASLAFVALVAFAACGEPANSGTAADLEGKLDCSDDDLISNSSYTIDTHSDLSDDPELALERFLHFDSRLKNIPPEKFQMTSGNPDSQEKGSEVRYAAADEGKKVADASLTNFGKNDWAVDEFAACQEFLDKYKTAQE